MTVLFASQLILFTKQAEKDKVKLSRARLEIKTKMLLNKMLEDPFVSPPAYEKLVGNLSGFYSRCINIQHRLVYEVDEKNKRIKVLRMWSHYE